MRSSARTLPWLALICVALACSNLDDALEPSAPEAGDLVGYTGPPPELLDDPEPEGVALRSLVDPVAAAGDDPVIEPKRGGRQPCGRAVIDSRTGRPLAYQGIEVYSNGACTGQAVSCGNRYNSPQACITEEGGIGAQPNAVDSYDPTRSGNRWQCVEFVKRVFARLYRVTNWPGHAYQMIDQLPRGVTAHRQGSGVKPVPGDAVVYGNLFPGHVALVSRVQGNRIYLIGQNEPVTFERQAEWRNGQLIDRSFQGLDVVGWVHATANPNRQDGSAAAPGPAPAPAGDCHYQHWNCTADRSGRFRCANGQVAAHETCAYDCAPQPAGRDDLCNPPPAAGPAPECSDRQHRYWTCNAERDAMFRCVGGRWEQQRCAGGCRSQWWDDRCDAAQPAQPPPPPPPPPAGSAGAGISGVPSGECNYRYWNCTADRQARFRCANGRVVDAERCPAGCQSMPNGSDDVCARSGGAPPRATPVCANTCPYAGDGECDDGGPGSLYAVCELGTDCRDCGRRD